MSTAIFPTNLPGLGFDVVRSEVWNTHKQVSVSGKETRIGYWSAPRWKWELVFNFLRADPDYREWQTLAAFFGLRQGAFDSFLYEDVDDRTVVGQQIGVGNGSTLNFQMVRSLGGFTEPVLAPQLLAPLTIKVNGSIVSNYLIQPWGAAVPGLLQFSAPPFGTISADFSYWWPCSFDDDTMSFNKFVSQIYEAKKVAFTSLK